MTWKASLNQLKLLTIYVMAWNDYFMRFWKRY